jgi:hypothetical protein
MSFRTLFFTPIGFCFLLSLNVAAQQQEKPSSLAKETGWTISIIEASLRDKISSWDNVATPANHKWLVLEVEIKVSKPPSFIPAKQVKVVDDAKGVYPVFAVADKAIPMFMNFKEQTAGFRDAQNNVTLVVGKDEKTNEAGMQSQVEKVSEMLLAFAVPLTTPVLYLQLGEGPRTVIKITEAKK